MSYLTLMRHGETEQNAQGIVSGNLDTPLTENGRLQARLTAQTLKDIAFDQVFISELIRTRQTLDELLSVFSYMPHIIIAPQLNERSWGVIQGRYQSEVDKEFTIEKQKEWMAWDCPVPGGESYRQVSERVVNYFNNSIAPLLLQGENCLIVGHNGTLRTLRRFLENVPHEEVDSLRLVNAAAYNYEYSAAKQVIKINN